MATLNPEPILQEAVGDVLGVAHCDFLGLLVVSVMDNTLRVFASPRLGKDLDCLYSLGGDTMQFRFGDVVTRSGFLAFTGPASARYLVVTDAGQDAVHVIDVVCATHVGYVAAPNSIVGPRGVAARNSLVAVSAHRVRERGDHVIQLFEGGGATWTPVRVLGGGLGLADGQLQGPWGLRFADDDDLAVIVVADMCNRRVSMFRVSDGSFVRQVALDIPYPVDVEEFGNGWLVGTAVILPFCMYVVGNGRTTKTLESAQGSCACLATVRNVGLVVGSHATVRNIGLVEREGRVQVFATYDAIAMAAMSVERVQWMAVVARGILQSCMHHTCSHPGWRH